MLLYAIRTGNVGKVCWHTIHLGVKCRRSSSISSRNLNELNNNLKLLWHFISLRSFAFCILINRTASHSTEKCWGDSANEWTNERSTERVAQRNDLTWLNEIKANNYCNDWPTYLRIHEYQPLYSYLAIFLFFSFIHLHFMSITAQLHKFFFVSFEIKIYIKEF